MKCSRMPRLMQVSLVRVPHARTGAPGHQPGAACLLPCNRAAALLRAAAAGAGGPKGKQAVWVQCPRCCACGCFPHRLGPTPGNPGASTLQNGKDWRAGRAVA